MSQLPGLLTNIITVKSRDKQAVLADIKDAIKQSGYNIEEENDGKPWGGYLRFPNDQADNFIKDFFSNLSSIDARLGVLDVGISPKILLVQPGQRLSWQFHNRRAERWKFLTDGSYNKSSSDDPGEAFEVSASSEIQFGRSERHRLNGVNDHYTIVAEIWQHTDPDDLSDEEDIIRLQDDYNRG